LSLSCHRRADDTENPDEIIEGYVEYIKHFVIIPKYDKGIIRYELSLFGIALVLNILEYCYNFEKNFNTPVIYPMVISLRRFCHNYQVKDYYENIALGYPEKIPLIFGKWNIIKKSLSHNELLTNAFSILVNKNRRMNIMSLPFTMGGFKEHYTSIQALAYNTTQKPGTL
jgi:hypothetical protein